MPSTLACGDIFTINNARVFPHSSLLLPPSILYEKAHSLHGHQQPVAAYPNNNKSCASYENNNNEQQKQKQIEGDRGGETDRETEIHLKF